MTIWGSNMRGNFELNALNFDLEGMHSFFKNISLTFAPGKIHCISGDNGVGKSTFFRIIGGKIKKSEHISVTFVLGDFRYESVNNRIPESFSRHVKMLSQNIDSLLVNKMSIAENMRLAHCADQPLLQRFIPQAILDPLLLHAGLDTTRIVEKLSGGQKQLLAFVMGYQSAGNIFLLDEPTAALDQANTVFLMDAITELARKKNLIIIMISHDHEMIKRYCTGYHYQIVVTGNRTREFVLLK
jgi:ABC-type multidrug transport system ATPase subunit